MFLSVTAGRDLHNIGNFFPLSDDATATLLRARATTTPPRTAVTLADLGHRGRREREGGETEKKPEGGGDRDRRADGGDAYKSRKKFRATSGSAESMRRSSNYEIRS